MQALPILHNLEFSDLATMKNIESFSENS